MALGDLLKQALEKHEAESQGIERLRIENDRLRSMLFPYANETQISGASWKGFYLIGNEASIKEFNRLQNDALQIEVYRESFDQRVRELTDRNTRLCQKLAAIREILGADNEG